MMPIVYVPVDLPEGCVIEQITCRSRQGGIRRLANVVGRVVPEHVVPPQTDEAIPLDD